MTNTIHAADMTDPTDKVNAADKADIADKVNATDKADTADKADIADTADKLNTADKADTADKPNTADITDATNAPRAIHPGRPNRTSRTNHAYVREILNGELELPPITTTLGATVRALDPEAGFIECDYQGAPIFTNPAGHIQGGILAAMLDDAIALLVQASLGEKQRCATLNLNVSYLRPAMPGLLTGRATLMRRGAQICNVEGQLWQNGKLVTTASAVCTVLERC